MTPGQVQDGLMVQLTANQMTLPDVQLALRSFRRAGDRGVPVVFDAVFTSVAPGTAVTATFTVTPPSYAINAFVIVHAVARDGQYDA